MTESFLSPEGTFPNIAFLGQNSLDFTFVARDFSNGTVSGTNEREIIREPGFKKVELDESFG